MRYLAFSVSAVLLFARFMVPPYAESAPMRAAPHATAFVAVLVLRGVLAGGGTDVEATLSQDCGAGGRRCVRWLAGSECKVGPLSSRHHR